LEQVGRLDNFFELGGHSLLALKVIARLRESGLQTDVRSLFLSPTLAAFGAAIDAQTGGIEVPPNRIPAKNRKGTDSSKSRQRSDPLRKRRLTI
jgi:arthrofactin-type cyclic lipopeptide synthetase A